MNDVPEGKCVLVVDDQPMMLRLCQAILSNLDYTVFTAESREEAIGIFQKTHPRVTLLITDIVMASDTEGIELADDVRRLYPHIQVIFMSGYAHGSPVLKMLSEKSTLFLHKPFVVSSMNEIVLKAEAQGRLP